MADNVKITKGGGSPVSGTVVAADDVGGVSYQYVKIDQGVDGKSQPVNVVTIAAVFGLMNKILKELKKMNMHLMIITDNFIDSEDVIDG